MENENIIYVLLMVSCCYDGMILGILEYYWWFLCGLDVVLCCDLVDLSKFDMVLFYLFVVEIVVLGLCCFCVVG